ncbi:putative lipoprotein [Minicystis rosea]|nr:putative lipoprotein [Minicystis rosea]
MEEDVRSLQSRLSGLVATLASLATACTVSLDDPADSASPEETAIAAEEMNGHNNLSAETLGHNALTANRQALAILRNHSLREVTQGVVFGEYPEMRYQLHDDAAFEVMRYVTSCALPEGTWLPYTDPLPPHASTNFTGELGLCPAWADAPPSQSCLERVSACLLARVNEVGARVSLSLRGDPAFHPMQPAILTDAGYKNAYPVKSLLACKAASYGPSRGCGFEPAYVGRCIAGQTVTIGAGANVHDCASPLGQSSGDHVLRVCKGIGGCDPTTPSFATGYAAVLAENDDTCGTLKPSVSFTCPANGPYVDPAHFSLGRYGYYSVMVASYDASVPAGSVTVAADVGSYPASETEVFTYAEGAFYGDVFDPAGLAAGMDRVVDAAGNVINGPNVANGVPTIYGRMFACYSAAWSNAMALMTDRLCAGPGWGCLIPITGACTERGPYSTAPASDPIHRCAVANASGVGDYDDCLDRTGSSQWSSPVTTYLNHPCDVVLAPGASYPASCRVGGPNGYVPSE